MKTEYFKYYILLIILIILFAAPLSAKNNSLATADTNIIGSKVYVLSNRGGIFENDKFVSTNSVNSKSGLDFIRANVFTKDSMQIVKLDSSDFLSEIILLEGNWLVFVHGDGKTLETSIWRALEIQKLYNINVLIFSWPSFDPSIDGAKNFKNSQSHVGESISHFVKVLDFVHLFREANPKFLKDQKFSLFFHSLGNLYMEQFVRNNIQNELYDKLFDNILLNAAAVNQKNHKEWVEKLTIQNNIFINSNIHDFNLKGVRIFTSDGKQLGEKIKLPLANNANYIHFDKSVGFRFPTGQTHSYFIGETPDENIIIKKYYYSLFHGEVPDFNNKNIFQCRKDKLGYELISKTK